MRTLNFAGRNFKEIVRDPLSIIFAVLLPLFLLIVFQQFKIPSEVYSIENFTPGIIIFSFSFITLFTATLVAKDRSTSLITRLCASPMKTRDYIIGYLLSVLPVILFQIILFFIVAIILGLSFSFGVVLSVIVSIPISFLFILLGILLGCITTEKSASGVSSIVVQLVAFTSGMYFSSEMMGEGFALLCKLLPFSHCLNVVKGALNHSLSGLHSSVAVLILWTIAVAFGASLLFRKRLRSDNK